MPEFDGALADLLRPPPGLVLERGQADGDDEVVLSFPLRADAGSHPPLTRAEEAVLTELLLGCSNAEISERRGVSVRTVANQLASLFRKLGVQSRLDAARVVTERMSRKTPRTVRPVAQVDPCLAQVSGHSDNDGKSVTHYRRVDRMG